MTPRARRYDRPASEFRDPASELAIPKPKFQPEREAADMSELAIPKNPPARSAAFLDYVRSQVCAAWDADGNHCGGVTEAAHLGITGLSSKSSDFLAVPLCSEHHRTGSGSLHSVGLPTFQLNLGVNLWETSARLQATWQGRRAA